MIAVCMKKFIFVFIATLLQIIQRQLEQVEEKQRQLEERGVAVEKALRGEAGTFQHSTLRAFSSFVASVFMQNV